MCLAASVAAALLGSSAVAAMTQQAPPPGILQGDGSTSSAGVFDGGLFGVPLGAQVAPFASSASSSLGVVSARGYLVTATIPRLLSGSLGPNDGRYYAVRDLEMVDRVNANVSLDFGYDLDLGRHFGMAGPDSPFTSLFLAGSTGLPVAEQDNLSFGSTVGVLDGLSLGIDETLIGQDAFGGEASLPYLAQASLGGVSLNGPEAQMTIAAADWRFAPWGRVDLGATHLAERAGALSNGAAPLSFSRSNANTLGASARIGFGSGWVTTFSYSGGFTQLDLRPSAAAGTSNSVRNQSYGVTIAKHGLFGDDSLGLAVTRPINLAVGEVSLSGMATSDPFDALLSGTSRPLLGSQAQPTDLELGYVTTFMDGALALQANAGYQMAGQPGLSNGLAVLSRAKINF